MGTSPGRPARHPGPACSERPALHARHETCRGKEGPSEKEKRGKPLSRGAGGPGSRRALSRLPDGLNRPRHVLCRAKARGRERNGDPSGFCRDTKRAAPGKSGGKKGGAPDGDIARKARPASRPVPRSPLCTRDTKRAAAKSARRSNGGRRGCACPPARRRPRASQKAHRVSGKRLPPGSSCRAPLGERPRFL